MKFVVAITIFLLAILPPQINTAQNSNAGANFFCPQCGSENKIVARFCAQCGTSLRSSMPTAMKNTITIDSTASARQELIRALLADPEFNRILQQQIQSTAPAALAVQPKPKPVRDLFSVIGGLTCTIVFFGLVLSL